jgi:metallo-beta-lactamase family protein
MEKNSARITFCAGAGTVTGANFLFEIGGKKILIDCGLIQSTKAADDSNWQDFAYDPASIDYLFITHAHVDHIGKIPKLVYDGFKGKIFSTRATQDLVVPMLEDTIAILGHQGEGDLEKIYAAPIVPKILALWNGFEYHEKIDIGPDFEIYYRDAGHILGSGMLSIIYGGKHFVFTGDLGNSPSPILKNTELVDDADYLIMESVYGDRNHESRDERRKKLEEVIEDNYKRKGTLIIPTFSLERTQELLFEINTLVENKRIPQMPIFLDSPLAIKLTKIYRNYEHLYNDTAREHITHGDDIFIFPGLMSTLETKESKHILETPNPKIIIAGSGMSNGGRIIHHEKNYLPNENNTLLLTGYQSAGTMGRQIEDGAKTVRIFGEDVPVRAHIVKISGYSGHKDSDHLVGFVEAMSERVQKVFVVMGEPKSSFFLVQKLRDMLGIDAVAPEGGETITISW